MRQLSRFPFTAVIVLGALAACDKASPRPEQTLPATGAVAGGVAGGIGGAPSAAPAAAPRARMVARRSMPPAMDEVSQSIPAPLPNYNPAAMQIRTATALVEVASLDPAVAAARLAAARYGGVVANAQVETGRNEVHRAVLQIKVPAPRFDSLLSGLAPLGRVESVQVSAEDVGEEYVDIEARLTNLRRLEARLIDLLANRTGKLSDVLSVERELARVRGEIEQIEGRRRFLERSVAMSTLELTLHEPERILAGQPGTNPIVGAFRDAWRYFVASIAWCISAMGFVVPIGVLIVIGAVGVRWGIRRLRGAGLLATPTA